MKVLVAGAGPVGIVTALTLQADGHDVICVGERPPERTSAAYGSGLVMPEAMTPLATPELLRPNAGLLTGHHPAGRITPLALPGLLGWSARALWQARRPRVRANAAALAALLDISDTMLSPWLRAAGAGELLRRHGVLALANGAHGRRLRGQLQAFLRGRGLDQELVGPEAVAALEPHLAAHHDGGLLLPGAFHTVAPDQLLQRLGRLFRERGGRLELDRLTDIRPANDGGVQARADKLGGLRADSAVIACGVGSQGFARRLGDRLPLANARGYYVGFPGGQGLLGRPVSLLGSGLTLSPMTARLQAGGRYVFAGALAQPQTRELDRVVAQARQALPALAEAGEGRGVNRPVTPDSVPVIGRSGAGGEIVYAFGHGGLALTLAGATGRLVADLVAYREPVVPPAPYRPQRFRLLG